MAGTIQAFEYCFELSWKAMRKLLINRGNVANSPRETFRMAALEGFIHDPEIWFDFLKKRNILSQEHDIYEDEQVIAICPLFSSEIKYFLSNFN